MAVIACFLVAIMAIPAAWAKEKLPEVSKVFTKVLTKAGHEVVDDVGSDVLLLRPAIINLDVTAPDLMTAGFSETYTASAGQMTLYMELYGSATSTLLARVSKR